MPNISMCQNDKCEKKETCYRYKAEPNQHYQSYALFKNICGDFNKYQWYWHMENVPANKE